MSTDVSMTITCATRKATIFRRIAAPGEALSTHRRLPVEDGRAPAGPRCRKSSASSGFRFRSGQASDAPIIGRHSLTDDLTLRLGQVLGGILDFVNGLRVQRERDFVGCHTSNILRPYGRVRLTKYLIGFGLDSLAVCHVRGRGQTDSTGVERHRLTLKLKRCCRKRYAIEPPPGNLPPSSQPSRSTLAGSHGRPARDREWKVSRARRAWSAQCGCLVASQPANPSRSE